MMKLGEYQVIIWTFKWKSISKTVYEIHNMMVTVILGAVKNTFRRQHPSSSSSTIESPQFSFQIRLESKEDDFGDCYIDFKIINNDGDRALNKQSEKQNCQTYGIKNKLDFGPGWKYWEGWVQLSKWCHGQTSTRVSSRFFGLIDAFEVWIEDTSPFSTDYGQTNRWPCITWTLRSLQFSHVFEYRRIRPLPQWLNIIV